MPQKFSFDQLFAYAADRSSDAERQAIAAALQTNPAVAAEVVRLRRMLAYVRTDELENAPQSAIQRASRLLRQRNATQGVTAAPESLFRRLIATLLSDSASQPAFGTRSSDGVQATRRLMFSAESIDLDIRVTPVKQGFVVTGQVLGTEAPGDAILAAGAFSVVAALNPLCEFTLPVVPAGEYSLTFRQATVEIVIPALKLNS